MHHVYVYSGRDGELVRDIDIGARFTDTVRSGFDFDADRHPDLAILVFDYRQTHSGPFTGEVRIISGRTGDELKKFPWHSTSEEAVQLVRPRNLPRLLVFEQDHETEIDAGGERFARERAHMAIFSPDKEGNARFALPIKDGVTFDSGLCIAGDLDGDGIDDIVRATRFYGTFFDGQVIAYSGATWRPIWESTGSTGSDFGASVAPGIDFDHDRVPDLIVGATSLRGPDHNGAVHGVSGKTGKNLWTLDRESP
jgi:outer membrane protein assembly factor BamB